MPSAQPAELIQERIAKLESVPEEPPGFPSGCHVVSGETCAKAGVMEFWENLWRPEHDDLRELLEAVGGSQVLVDEQGDLLGEEAQEHLARMYRTYGDSDC